MTTDSAAPKPPDDTKVDASAIVEKAAALYLDVLQQIRTSSMAQSEHADKMLTWAIGLMGAGVFYANNLLSTTAPGGLRFIALAPWILGILASLAARVIAARQMEANTSWYLGEVLAFRGEILTSKDWVGSFVAFVGSAVRLLKAVNEAMRSRTFWLWLRLWIAAHVLAGTGVLTVVAVSFLTGMAAALVIAVVIVLAAIVFLRAFRAIRKAYEDAHNKALASFASMRTRFEQDTKREQPSRE